MFFLNHTFSDEVDIFIKNTLDFDTMVALRLVRKNELVKILGRGELKSKLKLSYKIFLQSLRQLVFMQQR